MRYVAIASMLCLGLSATGCQPMPEPPAQAPSEQPAASPTPTIPEDAFEKLETGMTIAQANEVMGFEGTLDTETSGGGVTSRMYIWNDGKRAISASFDNDAMTAKSQTLIPQP